MVLTAAHNYVTKCLSDPSYEDVIHTDMKAYFMRDGQNIYAKKHMINKCVIHPKHDGIEYTGFDIAVCFLSETSESKNFNEDNYS